MRVCLDPGHSGNVNAGIVPGYYESNMNLALANYLKTELERYGAQVFMTREDTVTDPSLTERGQVAVANDCDLFFSIHSDANGNPDARGVTAIRSLKRPDSAALAKKLVDVVCEIMDAPVSFYGGSVDGVWTRESETTPGNDYYGVIRSAVSSGNVADVYLFEHSFHTNLIDCTFLADDANLQRLAVAEAQVIAVHYGLASVAEALSPEPVRVECGYASAGDMQKIMAQFAALLIPFAMRDGYITSNDTVSAGDQKTIASLCARLGVPCVIYAEPLVPDEGVAEEEVAPEEEIPELELEEVAPEEEIPELELEEVAPEEEIPELELEEVVPEDEIPELEGEPEVTVPESEIVPPAVPEPEAQQPEVTVPDEEVVLPDGTPEILPEVPQAEPVPQPEEETPVPDAQETPESDSTLEAEKERINSLIAIIQKLLEWLLSYLKK